MTDINHALVETTRPPLYTAMKYWGKKPHNIWSEYIKTYSPKNGLYLDPFSGGASSIFEAVKLNIPAIAFDLNPLTSFLIEVLSSSFDEKLFAVEVNKIINVVHNDPVYLKFFTTTSRKTPTEKTIIQHAKWEGGKLKAIGVLPTPSEKRSKIKKYMADPDANDNAVVSSMSAINIPYAYPNKPFHNTPTISASFIKAIGGNNFSNLWTKRTLYVLAKIFDEILKNKNEEIKKQLLFGFIQSLHLTTKMCVPRNPKSKRDFSTSWGRPAYMSADRQMEMNPLLHFYGSCIGKQSVSSALKSNKSYLGKTPKIHEVSTSNKDKNKLSGFDIKYGVVDINSIDSFIPENSIDFIMTDPPYGSTIQYLDLSTIWLNWLQLFDKKYIPNYSAEIIVQDGLNNSSVYQKRLTNAFVLLNKILKPEGKLIFTFHSSEIEMWNIFLKAISLSGLKVEKVIHQQNKRTGESNVSNPYGTSASDFYIRCIKSNTPLKNDFDQFKHFVISEAVEIVAKRNEPTPYDFLLTGLLTSVSSGGYDLTTFEQDLKKVLDEQIGVIFKLTDNLMNKAGNLWWFIEPQKYIKYPDRLLNDRVEISILNLLRRKNSVYFDDILAEIFISYPNGLTPDRDLVGKIIKKYATQSQGKWQYKQEFEADFTKHTGALRKLCDIGKKMGYQVFVGKREQPENFEGRQLKEFADLTDLSILNDSDKERIKRLEMIDMLWIQDGVVAYAIEVENSTNFTSGIQRASNLSFSVPKIMVLPDTREKEINKISDPLFKESFNKYNWKYIIYSDLDRLNNLNKIAINDFDIFYKTL